MKGGSSYIAVIPQSRLRPGVWDPSPYRNGASTVVLRQFGEVERLVKGRAPSTPFQPITYRDIPPREFLTFRLARASSGSLDSAQVGEGELLVGTLRAYLGNIVVTPLAGWLGFQEPVGFAVGSEFLVFRPYDGLTYFWLAYLRSDDFLSHVPLGSGGTRPRLSDQSFLDSIVSVPSKEARARTHEALSSLAMAEWDLYRRRLEVVSSF